MGINTTILPANSPYLGLALAVALAVVDNSYLPSVPVPQVDSTGAALQTQYDSLYTQAVYNLAGHVLIEVAQDENGAAPVPGSNPQQPFFAWSRGVYNINGFVSGVIQASGDESTNQSLVVMDAAKTFTMAQLQQMKTPWGRAYMAIAQSAGPTTWGMT